MNPRYVRARRPLFDVEMRKKYPASKAFAAPLRQRVAQPIPTQAREVTLAKREARKGRSCAVEELDRVKVTVPQGARRASVKVKVRG
jgi:hypothetical protein